MSSIAQPPTDSVAPTPSRLQPVATTAPKDENPSSKSLNRGWLYEHWSLGIVGGLISVEALALFVCIVDLVHFWLTGLSASDAWALVLEKSPFDKTTALAEASFVFLVFFVLLPAANAGLIQILSALADKIKKRNRSEAGEVSQPVSIQANSPLGVQVYRFLLRAALRRGRGVLVLHLLIAITISIFTVLMESIQVLVGSSYTVGTSTHPSFFSLWLSAVFAVKIATPAFFLPVARKYLVRMFGGEHPHFLEVLSEMFTEEGLKG